MNRYLKALAAVVLGGVLAACGGGGGSPGETSTGGTGGTGTTPTPTAATLIYELSSPTLSNTGNSSVTLTVTALDAKNNPVKDVPVTVSVDTGVFTPAGEKTDANGQFSGTISIGGNKANRTITANIAAGGKTATASVAVTGTTITLSPVPATVSPGGSTRIDIKVQDANGTGIPSVPVVLSGTLGLAGTFTTDPTGQVSATLAAAPTAPGTYSVDASAFGVQSTRTVQVIGSGGGAVADAVGPVSSASLAIVPNTIAPNTAGSTTNKAALRAKFLNNVNQAIPNVRVRYEIVPPGLGSGEQISTGTTVIYSDSNGEAIADYVAGTRSSPTNGVVIRACYALTDAAIANGACPNEVRQTLTVASQPLSITLGDNNLLEKGNNELTYIKKFDVAVVDAAGNAVPNAVVSASVDITSYQKGFFAGPRVTCANEDTNRNGFLDVGEDINNSGSLEPHKADITLSFLGSNTTSSSGRMAFQVEYPQNVATWLLFTIRATTNVAGSEGTVSKSFVTTYLQEDEENGSFLVAPYGTGACTSPN